MEHGIYQFPFQNLTSRNIWREYKQQQEFEDFGNLFELEEDQYWTNYYPSVAFQDIVQQIESYPVSIHLIGWIYNKDEGKYDKKEMKVKWLSQDHQISWYQTHVIGNGSDLYDMLISKIHIEHQQQLQQVIREPIQRSKIGQGSDLDGILEKETDKYYCPSSGNCLMKCMIKICRDQLKKTEEEILEYMTNFNTWCHENKITRDKISQAKVKKLMGYLNLPILVFKSKKIDPYCYYVKVIDGHYIWIKNITGDKDIRNIDENLIEKFQLTLKDCSLAIEENQIKISENVSLLDQMKDVFIWDCEAFKSQLNLEDVPFACAIGRLISIYKAGIDIIGNESKYVKDLKGLNPIEDTLDYINSLYKVHKITIKKGKEIKKLNQVYLYAHNSKGYDSYHLLYRLKKYKIEGLCKAGSGILDVSVKLDHCIVHFRCTLSHLQGSLKGLCKDFKLDGRLQKKDDFDILKVTEQNWQSLESEWLPYLQYDVISLAHVWSLYLKSIVKITSDEQVNKKKELIGIDIRKCYSSAGLAWRAFTQSLDFEGNREDSIKNRGMKFVDPKYGLYQFSHPYLKNFLRRSIHGGRCFAYKDQYESPILQKVMELYKGQTLDQIIYGSQDKKEKVKDLINTNTDYMMSFDATSLYPSAMNSIETIPDIRSAQVIDSKFDWYSALQKKQHFIIECDIWIPNHCKFPPIPYKTDKKTYYKHFDISTSNIQNSMGCYYSTGNLRKQVYNDLDISELEKVGGQVMRIYQGLLFTEKVQNPFQKFIQKFFNMRLQYKKENQELLAESCKLILNASYGKLVQKDITEQFHVTTQEQFIKEKYDSTVLNYTILSCGQVLYQQKKEEQKNSYPSIFGSYVLAESKSIMNKFILAIDGFNQLVVYYTDTDCLYIDSKYYHLLEKMGHCQDNLGGGKNDLKKDGQCVKASFLGPKQKICWCINQKGEIVKKITFKGIHSKKKEHHKTEEEWLEQEERFSDEKIQQIQNKEEYSIEDKRTQKSVFGQSITFTTMQKKINNKAQLCKTDNYQLRYIK